MIRFFILCCLLAAACTQPEAISQKAPVQAPESSTVTAPADTFHDNVIVCPVELVPQFPGGDKAFAAFLDKNLQYPAEAKSLGKEGTVFVQFLVDSTGELSEFSTIKWRHLGFGLEEEALRVVKLMPKWEWPSEMFGQKRTVIQYNLPIRFSLN
ncbi:energy transducer TonB [Chitinophaga sp.]|uniref:energy transducer TonB n=1 Tax=Chitinophaga sp. TaxID=1869181 RepID=UPI002617F2DA|nr:energy transducer TonB [uncultured Chitinophaga sp.]